MEEKKIYNNLLFFPLSEGVASPFNQVFLIFHYGKKKMLIVRPLKYSLRFQDKVKNNININHQPRTKHKKKREKVAIKSYSCLLFIGLM